LQNTDELFNHIIRCAEKVHSRMGPGRPEDAYAESLRIEFADAGITYKHNVPVPIRFGEGALGRYHVDFVVEDSVIVEIKTVEQIGQVHEAEVLTYLTATGMRAGLLINFNARVLSDGIKRITI